MEQTIEKIVINTESIDIIARTNNTNKVTQLNLESQTDEIAEIFERYNLRDITSGPFDIRIVKALLENEGQLQSYLEVCKNSNKKTAQSDNIPQIQYDLRDLKKSDMEMYSKIELYNKAKETQDTFKKIKGKVKVTINILDRAYFEAQKFLQDRNSNQPLPLPPSGHVSTRNAFQSSLIVKLPEQSGTSQNQEPAEVIHRTRYTRIRTRKRKLNCITNIKKYNIWRCFFYAIVENCSRNLSMKSALQIVKVII